MTRKEEIEGEANRTSNNIDELHSFIQGAEWADENPKKGLVNIDEVCEWIRGNWRNHIHKDSDGMIGFIGWEGELRKTMEK